MTATRWLLIPLLLAGIACIESPEPMESGDSLAGDADAIHTLGEDEWTTTVYHQPPVKPPPPADPGCSCRSWDLEGCGFQARGFRLKDYMAPAQQPTPWQVVIRAVFFAAPATDAITTTWMDARRDIFFGQRLCLQNNGADPGLDCPPECGPVQDVVLAGTTPVVYLVNMVRGSCSAGPNSLDEALGAPFGGVQTWNGTLFPGDSAWDFRPDTETFKVAFYDKYGFENGDYCISAVWDFSGVHGAFDWNRANDFHPNDVDVQVVESGDEDERYFFGPTSTLDENTSTHEVAYETHIDATLYSQVFDGGNALESIDGIHRYLPGLNEPLGSYNWHMFRSIAFPGPDAPVLASLSRYTIPFASQGGASQWAMGNRFLPRPDSPYAGSAASPEVPQPHPDFRIRNWVDANQPTDGQANTIDRSNLENGSLDRNYWVRVHPAEGGLSWRAGCYEFVLSVATPPGPSTNCGQLDVQQAPLQADGAPAATVHPRDEPGGAGMPAYLSSVNDIDWWKLVLRKNP